MFLESPLYDLLLDLDVVLLELVGVVGQDQEETLGGGVDALVQQLVVDPVDTLAVRLLQLLEAHSSEVERIAPVYLGSHHFIQEGLLHLAYLELSYDLHEIQVDLEVQGGRHGWEAAMVQIVYEHVATGLVGAVYLDGAGGVVALQERRVQEGGGGVGVYRNALPVY